MQRILTGLIGLMLAGGALAVEVYKCADPSRSESGAGGRLTSLTIYTAVLMYGALAVYYLVFDRHWRLWTR